jgi:hypothetical protein
LNKAKALVFALARSFLFTYIDLKFGMGAWEDGSSQAHSLFLYTDLKKSCGGDLRGKKKTFLLFFFFSFFGKISENLAKIWKNLEKPWWMRAQRS